MTESIHHPHDKLFRQVFSDPAEAAAFLQAHLPAPMVQGMQWTTLRQIETTFIDEAYQKRESDLLYTVRHGALDEPLYLYLLFEHQSTPDKWMRRRLWKYIDRIWDESFKQEPEQQWLKPVLPLVFYQGKEVWHYSTTLADLFPTGAREWSFLPHFTHYLVDQSGVEPAAVVGGLKAQIMQLLMLAAFHESREEALRMAAALFPQLAATGGIDYVRVFFVYVMVTQETPVVQAFAEAVKQHSTVMGGELMTYGEQLLQQGRAEGRAEGLLAAIELGLELKFGALGLQLLPAVRQVQNLDVLQALYEGIKTAQTLAELRELYAVLLPDQLA